jgi:hypothetical protein
VTSVRASLEYKKADEAQEGIGLHFVPWRTEWAVPSSVEFRCFCFHGRVTAISQYSWPRDVGLGSWSPERLERCGLLLIAMCERVVVPALSDETQRNWVVDLMYVRENAMPEFVEVNPFGAELPAGAALFHWIRDRCILYGAGEQVELRYVSGP